MPEARTAQSERIQTALAYLDAGFRGDNDACAQLLGESYVWIDRSQGLVAQTQEELLRVAEEHGGWVDRVFEIERVMESVDGTVIAQGTLTQTHMGTWRSIPPTGKRVTTACCEIIGFDSQGRVISEDAYQDDLSIMKQLGVLDLSATT
jgi:predicted ester cyclase